MTLTHVEQPVFAEESQSLIQFLDTNGDGTGTKNAIGDYSLTAEEIYIQPQVGTDYYLSRMIIGIEDGAGFRAGRYGGLASALTNGIHLHIEDSNEIVFDLDGGDTIKTNAGWGMHCYDVDLKTWGAGDELLLARWSFFNSGKYIKLSGDRQEKLVVTLNDSFVGLVRHEFLIQGFKVGKGVNHE